MNLSVQTRLAASILHCSPRRVIFDPDRLEEIKEVITKADLRSLINDGAIRKLAEQGTSRVRARVRLVQRRKGRQSGQGSRKGKSGTHKEPKSDWIMRIRIQREFVHRLSDHESITRETRQDVLRKCKGGFFRSTRHIKLYLEEHNLFTKNAKGPSTADSKAAPMQSK
jgi:large subunit ribosomal protein L19e